jgi:DNA invertase Pin-like site-specific DNA recombinase
MANYAYLRVSTDQQDIEKQKHGILIYANQQGIANLEFVEDVASGKLNWQKRKIGTLIESMATGDTIIFSEVSRIARSVLQVLEMLAEAQKKEINVHIAKQNMRFDGSLNSRITATILGLAAEIEREFISMRTKEALAKLKKDGVTLGRPAGGLSKKLKLDAHKAEITKYLKKGISNRSIAKLIECSETTLYLWLKRRNKTEKKEEKQE